VAKNVKEKQKAGKMSENAQKNRIIIKKFVHYLLNVWYNASTIKFEQQEVIT
jgi:hypothetical protein